MPALAVADELRADGAEVIFAGGERAEVEAVPAAGYELYQFRVEGLSRRNPFKAVRALFRAASATRRARALLRQVGADVVMGGGGYVAGPVGLAAARERIPLVLTEADSHLGLTNRLLVPFARRVCLAFPIPGRSGDRFRVTGRPIPPPATDRAAARQRFDVGPGDAAACSCSGARRERARSTTPRSRRSPTPTSSSSTRPASGISPRSPRPGPTTTCVPTSRTSARPCSHPTSSSRAPAARCSRSPAHGRPAVLVPYPHATADHQTTNAQWMASAGAAVVLADDELMPMRLRETVYALLDDPERLALMREASESIARPAAARAVAAQVLAAAESGSE